MAKAKVSEAEAAELRRIKSHPVGYPRHETPGMASEMLREQMLKGRASALNNPPRDAMKESGDALRGVLRRVIQGPLEMFERLDRAAAEHWKREAAKKRKP
jgi:hypothetical protein